MNCAITAGDCALQSWVYRIILQQQKELAYPLQQVAATPSTLSGKAIAPAALPANLQEIQEKVSGIDRQIFIMRFVFDLPITEVASLLSKKETVVKHRLSALRKLLAQHFFSGGEAV